MQHTDDLVGLDAYDRMLAAEMEYQRPLYGPRETTSQTAVVPNENPCVSDQDVNSES
jgi:hypothetical protein